MTRIATSHRKIATPKSKPKASPSKAKAAAKKPAPKKTLVRREVSAGCGYVSYRDTFEPAKKKPAAKPQPAPVYVDRRDNINTSC